MLRTDRRRRDGRHQSLSATIDWSYQLLDAAQRTVLARLAIFSGPVDLDAILSVVVDEPEDSAGVGSVGATRPPDRPSSQPLTVPRATVVAAIGDLVDRSMVASRRSGRRTEFRLLDTVRAFARERLTTHPDAQAVSVRHARAYGDRLDATLAATRGPDEAAAVLALDHDWPELRAAVDWSVRHGRVDLAVPLVTGLGFEATFRERGEIIVWIDRVLAMPGVVEHPRADELLGTAGLADWAYGRFDLGLARAETAVRLHRERRTRLAPDVAAALPLHLSLRGDLHRTIDVLHAHRDEAARSGVPFAHVHMYVCEAMGCAFAGMTDDADRLLDEAHAAAEQLGCTLLRAIVAFTRAIADVDRMPERAAAHARTSLALGDAVGATWFRSAGSNYLVAALARGDDVDAAVTELVAALDRLQAGATVQSVANALRNTVVVLERLGAATRATPLIGWLTSNRPAIPGSPGMRTHPAALAEHLRSIDPVRTEEQLDAGGRLTSAEAVALARQELDPYVQRLGAEMSHPLDERGQDRASRRST